MPKPVTSVPPVGHWPASTVAPLRAMIPAVVWPTRLLFWRRGLPALTSTPTAPPAGDALLLMTLVDAVAPSTRTPVVPPEIVVLFCTITFTQLAGTAGSA